MKPGIILGPLIGVPCSRFLVAWELDADDEACRWILAYSPVLWLAPIVPFKSPVTI